MQSKISYFNKTIFLKNITRCWPIWAAYLLVCLFRLPFKLYVNLTAEFAAEGELDITSFRNNQMVQTVVSALKPEVVFLFAAITALAVFSYLYKARNANMIHALPVTRSSLFVTNCLSGFTFLIVPQVIAFLSGIFICFANQVTHLEFLLQWFLLVVGISFFAFSFAVFSGMITGSIFAGPFFYFIFNYLYIGLRILIDMLIVVTTYGFSELDTRYPAEFLSPLYYLERLFSESESNWGTSFFSEIAKKDMRIVGLYCIAGVLFLAAALFLYQKRQLETASDVLSIPFVKPLFRWVLAFGGGGIVSVFIVSLFMPRGDLTGISLFPVLSAMVIIGILIFFLVEMLFQKNVRVFSRKRILECGIYSLIVTGLLLCLNKNVFGMETRLPEQAEIASVYFYGTYPVNLNEKDFSQVLALHQKLLDSKEEFSDYFKRYKGSRKYTNVKIFYTLKNGVTMKRSYNVPVEEYYMDQKDSALTQMLALCHDPEYYLRYHFTDNYGSPTFFDGAMDYFLEDKTVNDFQLNQEQCIKLYEAFQKDVREGFYHIYDYNFYDLTSDYVYYNTLFFSYTVPQGTTFTDFEGNKTISAKKAFQTTSINITKDCRNTIAALKDMGIINDTRLLLTQKESDVLFKEDYENAEYDK